MLRAMLQSLLAHRVSLAMTARAVALGTGFMCGSFVFTASLTHSLDSLFAQASAGTDVEVRHVVPAGAVQGAGSAAARPIPASIATAIRALPGVAAADGTVSDRAVLLARTGKPLPAPFVAALSWPADAPFQVPFAHRTGQPPSGPGQIMIDRDSARAGHFTLGDRIEVAIGGQARRFTITGITGYGSAGSIAGGSLAIFDLRTAQRLFGRAGSYDTIQVKAVSGVPAQQLRDRVAHVLPPGVEAVTAANASASEARQLNSQLGILTSFFVAFAGVALFVGAFVIWNTFSIMIGQRARELALLRALGAGRGQVFRSVLTEAAVVGTVAAIAGAGLGILVAKGLAALLVPAAQVAIACAIGLVITLIAGLAPAYRASRVAPVQALRDAVPSPVGFSAARLVAGLVLTGAGVAMLLAGLLFGAAVAITAAGAAVSFIGVTVLGPLMARPLAYLVGLPLTRLPARVGILARGNTMRNPKRTSATAAALMIGLAVITAASVLVSTATFTADTGRSADTVDLVKAPASARGNLQRVLGSYPGAQLLDQAGYAKSRGSTLGSLLNLITALLVLAVIVALLGIVNTLALSIVER